MSQIAALALKVREFTDVVHALLTSKPPHADHADDADLLGGVSRQTLTSEGLNVVSDHTEDTNNPHGVTLAQLGGVTRDYVDTALEPIVSLTDLPVSQFGDTSQDSLGITFSGWTLQFTKGIQSFMQGVMGILPIQNINLTNIDANPGDKSFYVFLRLEGGLMTYQVTTQKLPESIGLMYIGTVFTSGNGITSHSIKRVTRLGIYRVSTTPSGSSIPAASGTHSEPAMLDLGWTSG